MRGKNSLSCMEKRNLLNQPAVSTEVLRSWGDRFFQMAHWNDAIDFYEKVNERQALEKILEVAKEEGDLFLFNRVCRALNMEPEKKDLQELAQQAEALGKERFASDALKQAGVDVEEHGESSA